MSPLISSDFAKHAQTDLGSLYFQNDFPKNHGKSRRRVTGNYSFQGQLGRSNTGFRIRVNPFPFKIAHMTPISDSKYEALLTTSRESAELS